MGVFGAKKTCPSCGAEISGRETKCPRCWMALDGAQHQQRRDREETIANGTIAGPEQGDEEVNAEVDARDLRVLRLHQEIKSGASWFYFIAALTAANTVVTFAGGSLSFILALGVTQVIDEALSGAEPGLRLVGLLLNLTICAGIGLCGFFGNRHNQTAFVVGMVAYALDSVFFIMGQDWLGAGLHGVGVFFMFKGYLALRKCAELEEVTADHAGGLDSPLPYGSITREKERE